MQIAQSVDILAQKPKHFTPSEVHLRTPLIEEVRVLSAGGAVRQRLDRTGVRAFGADVAKAPHACVFVKGRILARHVGGGSR